MRRSLRRIHTLRSRKLIGIAALAPALAASSLVLGTARTASALPLITFSGSARGLYGSSTADLEPTPYGAGVGLRLGVTLPTALYLGGSLDYFFGGTNTVALGGEVSASLLQLMGRAGYDLGLGPVSVRPQLGFGLARTKLEFENNLAGTSDSDFVLAPGVELGFSLGLLTLGAEVSYNKVFADSADAVVFGVGVGFSL
jgi:hypothetical protein